MSQKIQVKVNQFLINVIVPVISKRMKKRGVKGIRPERIRNGIEVSNVREEFNLFTISERRDLFLAKYTYKCYRNNEINILIRPADRAMPIISQLRHNTKTYENYILYRGINVWNRLPRGILINGVGLNAFIEIVKAEIKKNRLDDFMYY